MQNNLFFRSCFSLLFLLGMTSCSTKLRTNGSDISPVEVVQPIKSVAALGELIPLGDVRRLAAPVSGFGGTPRIAELFVKEGQRVKKGEIIALFDNRRKILSDLQVLNIRKKTLDEEIKLQEREISRYKLVASQGAASYDLLDEKENELIKLQGLRYEIVAEKKGLEADYADSQLQSPIDGSILRIHSRVGERPGSQGVVEVGANQFMEALIEVYESDINRVQLNQKVSLISENGGFLGTLDGIVKRISPQVRQRKVLSTDPTGDVDARVIEVRVSLAPSSSSIVKDLTGMKVIAIFK